MPNATIFISDYKNTYANLNGSKKTHISKIDIARGILSIGKTHWTQYFKSPKRTIIDFLHYWSGLENFIIESPNLSINQNYSDLDLSDKIQKSYQIGMGVSKIVAERVLKIPFLQHVDSLVQNGVIALTSGTNERGDMVGLDKSKNWHVMEAKGRTKEPTNNDKTKAKIQAEKIETIGGVAPDTKSYCITHINENGCEIFLTDPDDKPIKKVEFSVKENDFIKIYYDKIFKDFYEAKQDVTLSFIEQNISFSLFSFEQSETKVYIGLENRILENLRKGNTDFTEILEAQSKLYDSFQELNFQDLSIGNDGILLFQDNNNMLKGRLTEANKSLGEQGMKFLE